MVAEFGIEPNFSAYETDAITKTALQPKVHFTLFLTHSAVSAGEI